LRGIIIPDSAKEKPQRGTVIAAGNGKVSDRGDRTKLDVKAGDTILFGKYSGQEIKLDGVEYLIMKEEEVLGAIEGAGATRGGAIQAGATKAGGTTKAGGAMKAGATKAGTTKTHTTRRGR